MQNLGQAIQEAVMSMTDCPSDAVHICPFCSHEVPKLQLDVLGVIKVVQPRCRCEVQDFERGMTEAAEHKSKAEIERKFSISNLGARFAESRFEAFQPRSGAENAHMYAKQYAQSFPDYGGDALLVWGDPGNGKSHLAAAVCHEVKEKGFIPVFQSVPELLERIRNTFRQQKGESEREIMDALLDCDLLVLDDVGAEKVSDWVQDILFRVIDGRYRQRRPIFYTSNLRPSELRDRLGPRIYDRMMETSLTIENKAASYRVELAEERLKNLFRGAAHA